jgi:5-hydroxyisourate hydrolase
MAMITAEVLDGAYGQAASAIALRLERHEAEAWATVARACAGGNGRVDGWGRAPARQGLYRLSVDASGYFAGLGLRTAFPEVQVTFRVEEEGGCHVQVVLAPFAYSADITTRSAPRVG